MSLREAIRIADITEVGTSDYTEYREATEKVVEILQESGDCAIVEINLPNKNHTEASYIMNWIQFEAEDTLDPKKKVHGRVKQIDREDGSKGSHSFPSSAYLLI